MISRLVVIGNGESRKKIDFKKVQGTKIGCNAIHRECTVDHLVCVDRRTLREAHDSPNTANTKIHTRPEWRRMGWRQREVLDLPLLPYQGTLRPDKEMHWGSGPYAVLLASTLDDDIHLLGFDLYGIDGKINNVYKGTENYSKDGSSAVDPGYWIYQISKVFQCFPDKYYHIYNTVYWKKPDEWKLPNVCFKEVDMFAWSV